MDKTAVRRKTVAKIDPAAPFRWYHRNISRHPALEIPLLTALGAGTGYVGAKQLGYKPAVGAGLLGLLALLYSVGKHVDLSGGFGQALQSLIQSDYYKKHPEAAAALRRRGMKRIHYAKPITGQISTGRRLLQAAIPQIRTPAVVKRVGGAAREMPPDMQKESSEKHAFGADEIDQEVIPVNYSSLLVEADPFLAPDAKKVTIGLLRASKGADAGMTSGRKLFKAAVKAGAGYGSAYLFGRGLTTVLGAGTDISKKLSKIGGIAAAVLNSGILNEFGE